MTTPAPTPDPGPQTPDPAPADAWLTPARFALVLAALLAVTFWRVLFGGEAFFYRDYGFLGYPFAHFHRECFWNGDFFPLWNPYVNCGAPFLAQWNTLCLYPGALIYLLLPLPWSLGFFCVVHLFLGGMGMRALAERWAGSRFGAAVAGVAFVFSGLVMGCVIYPNYLVALGWMPWVVLATRRAWQEGGRAIVLAALAGAMQMLTGAPEIILLTWGLLAGLMLMDWVQSPKSKVQSLTAQGNNGPLDDSSLTPPPSALRPTNYYPLITRFLAVIGLITGLCAAQLLPFFQLLSLSQRSGDAVNTFWSLPGWGWVNLFFPLFMNFQTEQGVFVMIGQSFFPSVYLGVVPLTLALLAVWRVRTPEVKVLGVATLLAVLLAMGEHTPLWGWLRAVLPLGVMRFPVKMLLLAGFTVPLLAAWGIRQLFDHPTVDRATTERSIRNEVGNAIGVLGLVLGLGLVAGFTGDILPESAGVSHAIRSKTLRMLSESLIFALAFVATPVFLFYQDRRLDRWTPLLVLIMIPLCGATSLPDLNPTIPASAFQPGLAAAYHESKGALTPAPKLGESRIMLSPQAERLLHTRMVPKFYDDFIGERLAFWGNLNLLDGLPKVNGASTLVTREWNEVENFLYGTTNPAPANLMDFLGVTHTTKPGELMQWERRTTAMPLVTFCLGTAEFGPDPNFAMMRRADWNPRASTFLTRPAANGASESTSDVGRPPVPSGYGTVRVAKCAATEVEIAVDGNSSSGVVIAQNFFPSWRATVNGQSAPVWRANHAFQAIPIPAGKSTVRLHYVDWPFRIGTGISLATLLGCLVLWRRTSKEG